MKKALYAFAIFPTIAFGAGLSGDQIVVNSTTGATNSISSATTGGAPTVYSTFSQTPTSTYINTIDTSVNDQNRSGIFTQSNGTPSTGQGVNMFSTNQVSLYSGTYSGGNITNNNLIYLSPTELNVVTNATTTLQLGNETTNNGISISSNNIDIGTTSTASPTINIGAANATTNISGTTNVNTTGTANTNVGNSTGTVAVTGANVNVTGTTGITGATTVTGTTNVNTTGTANTNVGNSTGTVAVTGANVNVARNSGSTVVIGSDSSNSNVYMNGNRIQNVGNAIAGTDAVNFNQLNNVQSNLQGQINNLQNQYNDLSKKSYAGSANVAAIAGIPALPENKMFNVGFGFGNYISQSAGAFGGHVRVSENTVIKAAVSYGTQNMTTSAGVGFSF